MKSAILILIIGGGGFVFLFFISVLGYYIYNKMSVTTPANTSLSGSGSSPTPSTRVNTCDATLCQQKKQSYIDKKWNYTSSDFSECYGCPVTTYSQDAPPVQAYDPSKFIAVDGRENSVQPILHLHVTKHKIQVIPLL